MKERSAYILAGACAGAVTGLFGGGGGMILVPLLCALTRLEDEKIFPTSVSIILPVCITAVLTQAAHSALPLRQALPYLFGSAAGGVGAGLIGDRIPTKWLHRFLGIMILWGGVRYLC